MKFGASLYTLLFENGAVLMLFLYNSQYHTITTSDCHSIVISYDHNITTPNGWSHFRSQVKVKNTNRVFYPLNKEVSPKIRPLRAITFHDASANADQKFIAPPKPHFFKKKSSPDFFASNFFWKNFGGRFFVFKKMRFWRGYDFLIRDGRCVVKSYYPKCPYFWGDFLGGGVKDSICVENPES